MLISANLGFLYTDLPDEARVRAAAADGFDAVEFHWPYDCPAPRMKEVLAETGLAALGVNTRRGDVDAGDFGLGAVPGREAEADRHLDEAVAYAAAAGIGAVHVMAGKSEGPEAEAAFLRHLARACEIAAPHGVGILIEPINSRDVPGYFLSEYAHAAALQDRLGHPSLKIMYDIYHMGIMHTDVSAVDTARLGHVQVASVPARAEPTAHEMKIASGLIAAGYSGAIGAEYRPTLPPGDWLKALRD